MAKTSGGTRGGKSNKSALSKAEVDRVFGSGLSMYRRLTTAIININNGDRDPSQKSIVKELIPRMQGMRSWVKKIGEERRFIDATESIVRTLSSRMPDNMIAANQVRDIVLGKAKEFTTPRLKKLMM